MSKIANDGLTRSGTGYFLYMATVGVKGLTTSAYESRTPSSSNTVSLRIHRRRHVRLGVVKSCLCSSQVVVSDHEVPQNTARRRRRRRGWRRPVNCRRTTGLSIRWLNVSVAASVSTNSTSLTSVSRSSLLVHGSILITIQSRQATKSLPWSES